MVSRARLSYWSKLVTSWARPRIVWEKRYCYLLQYLANVPPYPGLVTQKDTVAVSLQKEAPKAEPMVQSYPPGTLGNVPVKTSRVRQFIGGGPDQKRSASTEMRFTKPNEI